MGNLLFMLTLVLVGVLSRLFEHAPNLTPIVALSLIAGRYLNFKLAILVPVLILGISNLWLGGYDWVLALAVYGSFCLPAVLGRWAKTTLNAVGLAFIGSCCFFIISNFVVWFASGWYPQNFEGLVSCYISALPFFRNALIGDLGFTFVIFGSLEFCLKCSAMIRESNSTDHIEHTFGFED